MGISYSYTALPERRAAQLAAAWLEDGTVEIDDDLAENISEFVDEAAVDDWGVHKHLGIIYDMVWKQTSPEWRPIKLALSGPPTRYSDGERMYLDPTEVRAAAAGLAALPIATFDVAIRTALLQYVPHGGDRDAWFAENLRDCMEEFNGLRGFYEGAAKRGNAVFISIG